MICCQNHSGPRSDPTGARGITASYGDGSKYSTIQPVTIIRVAGRCVATDNKQFPSCSLDRSIDRTKRASPSRACISAPVPPRAGAGSHSELWLEKLFLAFFSACSRHEWRTSRPTHARTHGLEDFCGARAGGGAQARFATGTVRGFWISSCRQREPKRCFGMVCVGVDEAMQGARRCVANARLWVWRGYPFLLVLGVQIPL